MHLLQENVMKRGSSRWIVVLGLSLMAAHIHAQEPQALKTDKAKISYGLGVGAAKNFQRDGIGIDIDLYVQGLKDTLSAKKLLMTEEELQTVMTKFGQELNQRQAELAKATGAKNKTAGDAFLAENKKKPGVVVLPSGLQYKVLKSGTGKKATDADSVECVYRGTFVDGTEFENTTRKGKPATIALKDVIPGWKQALKLMPVGSKWQLVVPPELAYQERGYNFIGPNATLIFEIEVTAIK
jgi:FKBP-type peptidyl-prolyl cis-trans isomerase